MFLHPIKLQKDNFGSAPTPGLIKLQFRQLRSIKTSGASAHFFAYFALLLVSGSKLAKPSTSNGFSLLRFFRLTAREQVKTSGAKYQ